MKDKKLCYFLMVFIFFFCFSINNNSLAFTKKLNQQCLKCHKLKRAPKVLPNGEKMYLYVDSERFNKSAHGVLNCILCHQDIDPSNHPKPVKILSKKSYAKQVTQNCLGCHAESGLSSFHKNVIKENKVTCDECHTAHYIKTMKTIKEQTKACIKCHKLERLPKILPNGEKMCLRINPKEFAKSPHAEIGCFACHFDIYNSNKHPYPKPIKSKRAYAKEVVKNCVKCHTYSSLSKHRGHAAIIKSKKFICIDCHAYHKSNSLGR